MPKKEVMDKFYKEEVTERRNLVDGIAKSLAECVVSNTLIDNSFLASLMINVSEVRQRGDLKKQMNKRIDEAITKNQKNAAVGATKHCYYSSTFTQKVLEEASKNPYLQEVLKISKLNLPEKVKYYLLEAKKCYHFKSYDATIVMIARAIEFSLKAYLTKNKVKIEGKAVMGNLIKAFEEYGHKQDILKYVFEVQRYDRNICAHDSEKERQKMTFRESDHSWTAIKIILKDLLDISI